MRHRVATLAYVAASSSFETAGQHIRACMQVESRAASHACMAKPESSTSVFAQEVDGGGSEGMLLNRSFKRLLSNNSEE